MPKVLLLGAGLVAAPAIRYLADRQIAVVIAANNPERARALLGDAPGEVVSWSVEDEQMLARLVGDADVVISLLPATMHLSVARACIAGGRSLVTASYATDAIRALDAAARERGVCVLSEMGLDPGIDHMSAMRLIDAATRRGEAVLAFRSYCGGIPAPDAVDNPWGYKFSWSPEGALRATLSAMRYRQDGAMVELSAEELMTARHELQIEGLPPFEAYPNRDSLGYEALYGIEGAATLLRGTLRWPGWCAGIGALRQLGLLVEQGSDAASWAELVARRVAAKAGLEGAPLQQATAAFLGLEERAAVMEQLAFLDLFAAQPALPAVARRSVLAALAQTMLERMSYGPGEHDLVAMHHELITRRADGSKLCTSSSLVVYGDDRETAMAKTVGVPAAIGARMVLEGGVVPPGAHIPISSAIYEPALRELEAADIVFAERAEVVPSAG